MRLAVDHVSLSRGARTAGAPGFRASETASLLRRNAPRTSFYSLCVLSGPAADQVTPVVSDALHAELAKTSSRSLTSTLLRALRAAQDALSLENARSLPQHRCSGSLCAAAVKEDVVYVAYVGGGLVYAWQAGALRRLGGPDLQEGQAWGSEEADIGLCSCRLAPGDALILASVGLTLCASDEDLAAALARWGEASPVEALESVYAVAPQQHDFSAVVLRHLPPTQAAARSPLRSAEPLEVIAPAQPAPRLPERQGALPASPPAGRWQERSTFTEEEDEPLSTVAPRVKTVREATLPLDEPKPRLLPTISSPSVPSLGRIGSALGPSLVRVLLRFSIAAIVVAAVAGALYLGEELWQSQARQKEAEETLALLQQKERDALAATDVATRRWLLTEADRAAERALSGRVVNEEIVAVAQRIRTRLDEVNGIVRLGAVQVLADFATLEGGSQPAQLLPVGDDLYVLDRGIGGLWHVKLGRDPGAVGTAKRLWRRSDQVAGVAVGEAMAAFWMHGAAPGVPEQVYVLESGGHLIGVAQGAVARQPIKLPAAGALAQVRAAAGQAGNLYVLDTQRRLIWRYTPGASGYEGAAEEYLTEAAAPDLANTVDLALDGNLYLLFADGRIAKYVSGKAQPFPAVVPDVPLRRPSGVFASPATRFVYVADAGNARVVKFTKEGQYVNQYRAAGTVFDDLRGVFVDEEGGRLYAVAGTRALMAQLPAEGR